MSFGSWYLSFLSFFLGGVVVGTLAHEAGHVMCARIGSIPLRRMVIGAGPVLVRGHIGDLRVEVRLVPIGSMVTCAESTSMPKRWAVVLYRLGGVLGNVVMVGAAVLFHVIGAAPSSLPDMPLILAPVSILVASQVVYLLSSPVAPILYARSPLLKRYREGTTRLAIGSGSFAFVRIAYRLARADRQNNPRNCQKALVTVRRELSRGSLTPEEEMYALDWLIINGLAADKTIAADPVLRPTVDEWSQSALQLGPKVKTLVASRGAVLVELGRYHEGRALLQTVVFANGAPLLDSLLNRIFLARAEHALGNPAAAGRLIAEARAIARAGVRGPALGAWLRRIQREVREMRSRRPRVRRHFGRRSLKAQGKLSLPRPRARLRHSAQAV